MSLTSLGFAAVFAAFMALALFRHPLWGLYAYVALFYLHPPSRWWGEMLPDLRWALVAALVTLIGSMRLPKDKTRPSWISSTPAKLLIAYTLWCAIQIGWALDRDLQIELTVLFAKYVLLFYLIYRLIDTEEKVRDLLLLHIGGCLYFGYLAYTMEVSGRLEGVGGPGVDEANAMAMQLGTAVAIAAMLLMGERGWRQWLCFAALPFILNTIVLAGSRGAFVALLASGLALWHLKPDAYRKVFYVFAALGLVLFGMLAHQTFWERVSTIKLAVGDREELDTSALSRFELVSAQWQMFLEHPQGVGHRGTADLSVYYLEEEFLSLNPDGTRGARSSHNTFMSALVEQGIVGAILFVWLWLWAFRAALRIRDASRESSIRGWNLAAAIAGALTVVFVAGLFVDYLKAEVQIWMFALLACLLSIERRAQPADAANGAGAAPDVGGQAVPAHTARPAA